MNFPISIGLVIEMDIGEIGIGFFYFLSERGFVTGQPDGDTRIAKSNYLCGKDSGVLRSIHPYGSHGNSWRHLHDGEQCIKTIEHSFNGYTYDGQGSLRGNDTGQGCCHAGSGNDDTYAALLGIMRKLLYGLWSTVGLKGLQLERYL